MYFWADPQRKVTLHIILLLTYIALLLYCKCKCMWYLFSVYLALVHDKFILDMSQSSLHCFRSFKNKIQMGVVWTSSLNYFHKWQQWWRKTPKIHCKELVDIHKAFDTGRQVTKSKQTATTRLFPAARSKRVDIILYHLRGTGWWWCYRALRASSFHTINYTQHSPRTQNIVSTVISVYDSIGCSSCVRGTATGDYSHNYLSIVCLLTDVSILLGEESSLVMLHTKILFVI